jgi:hypothetical protein
MTEQQRAELLILENEIRQVAIAGPPTIPTWRYLQWAERLKAVTK